MNQPLLLPIALALTAGAVVTLQPLLNAQLARHLESPLRAGLVSFTAGAATLICLLLATRTGPPSAAQIAQTPPHLWIVGGMLGAFFVTAAIWAAPKLGVTSYFGLVIAAQLIAALALDHFGALGLAERALTPTRMLGVGLLIGGAIIVNRS